MKHKYHYTFTWHLRDRYVSRFLMPEHKFTQNSLKKFVQDNKKQIDHEIVSRLSNAKEEASLASDAAFNTYLRSRYGNKEYKFLANRNILFILVIEKEHTIVITCFCWLKPD